VDSAHEVDSFSRVSYFNGWQLRPDRVLLGVEGLQLAALGVGTLLVNVILPVMIKPASAHYFCIETMNTLGKLTLSA